MEKKNKKVMKSSKSNRILAIILIVILVVMLLLYVANSMYSWLKQPTNIFLVENGEVIQEETVDGYIIREETVLQGENYKNGILQIKTEGQRVSNGSPIFRYYSESEEEIKEELAQIDSQIQNIMDSNTSVVSSDKKLLETQIKQQIDELYKNNN